MSQTMSKTEKKQMELTGELGRAAQLARLIIGEGNKLTPFMLTDVFTSVPVKATDASLRQFVEQVQSDLVKAKPLVNMIFGILPEDKQLEAAVAIALRIDEDADNEDIEVFVEDFQFAVTAVRTGCDGAVDVPAACTFFDEMIQ